MPFYKDNKDLSGLQSHSEPMPKALVGKNVVIEVQLDALHSQY